MHCPICNNTIIAHREKDYGNKELFECVRCGKYEISRAALNILPDRFTKDNLAKARLSHAIRLTSSDENIILINSINVDKLIQQPLPNLSKQVESFLQWLKSNLEDNELGRIEFPNLEYLASIIGAEDAKSMGRLIKHLEEEGLIELLGNSKKNIGITAKGLGQIRPLTNEKTFTAEKSVEKPDIIKSHCNKCHGDRNCYKRTSFIKKDSDGVTSWSDTYDILECCGCGEVSIKHEYWFSEWDAIGSDPITGKPFIIPGIRTTYWPTKSKRKKPDWIEKIKDKVLSSILSEIYYALDVGAYTLASIGARTLLDRAMYITVGDKGSFQKGLQKMQSDGYIGLQDKEILQIMIDVGNASTHRGFTPETDTLNAVIDVVENFLQREFILKEAATHVKSHTPPREKTAKKSQKIAETT